MKFRKYADRFPQYWNPRPKAKTAMTNSKLDLNTKPYSLKFTIQGLPKMSNQLLRGHWQTKHAHAKKWKGAVRRALAILNKPAQPLTSAALCLVRESSVEPDFDGLVSSFKSVIDGLVEEGVLKSDKSSCIGQPKYQWVKGKPKQGRIIVEVLEVTDA